MMVFSIYDRGSEAFNQIFTQPTAQAAVRIIKNELRQENSMLAAHPTDFELWRIGNFDPQTGELKGDKERVVRIEDLMGDIK